MSFYNQEELLAFGFKSLGSKVKISRKASIYNSPAISIGDNTRIDDFCVISAGSDGINIGKNVHIAVFSSLQGASEITIQDYSNISSRVSIYSSTDDFSGMYMTNPTVEKTFTNVISQPVEIGSHVIVGSGTIIMPSVKLCKGVAVGAMSFVKESFDEFVTIAGIPAKIIGTRSRDLLKYEPLLR